MLSGTFAHGVMCDVRDVRQDQGADWRRATEIPAGGGKSLVKGQPRRFGGS